MKLLGSETPRLFTRPLRKLTRKTSLGFAIIDFAEQVLSVELLPYQKWWLIHAFELLPGGGFRFKVILTLIARQNGKTFLLRVVALFFMYVRGVRLVLGAAQSLDIARESWQGVVDMAQDEPELAAEVEVVRRTNGEQELRLVGGSRYRITAASRSAGRGLTVDLLVLDELREHRSWDAWSALSKTVMARADGIIIGISNAGDDTSCVLNALRDSALAGTDDSLAIFEWSAEPGSDLADPKAWASANPGLGHTISEQAIRSALSTDPPATFRTEVLCEKVDALDTAVDMAAWRDGRDTGAALDEYRDRVAVSVEVGMAGHVTLAAAAELPDGRVRVEIVAAWSTTDEARNELDATLAAVSPRRVAWFPGGPAAVLAPVLRAREDSVELKGAAVTEACQGLADLVKARRIVHPDDPLLNAHIAASSKHWTGDGWRFARRGGQGNIDAAYAAAGAVLTAQQLPEEKPISKMMVV